MAGKPIVPRPLPRIPGTHHGVASGGEVDVPRPPPLPVKAELKTAVGRVKEPPPATTSDFEDIRKTPADPWATKTYVDHRIDSTLRKAQREVDTHAQRDTRSMIAWIGLAAAIISGVVAVGTAIGSIVVKYVGGIDEMQESTRLIQKSAVRTEERLTAIEKAVREVADQGFRGREELRQQIAAKQNPPEPKVFAAAVRRELASDENPY